MIHHDDDHDDNAAADADDDKHRPDFKDRRKSARLS